jgi:hypothetical protein
MMVVKTRTQGNAVTVTIPKKFHVEAGVSLEPELTEEGILYRFVVDKEPDAFDFDAEIMNDLFAENLSGQAFINEFERRKKLIPSWLETLTESAMSEPTLTKEEARREIGL